MRHAKRFGCGLLAMALLAAATPAQAQTWADVDELQQEARDHIDDLALVVEGTNPPLINAITIEEDARDVDMDRYMVTQDWFMEGFMWHIMAETSNPTLEAAIIDELDHANWHLNYGAFQQGVIGGSAGDIQAAWDLAMGAFMALDNCREFLEWSENMESLHLPPFFDTFAESLEYAINAATEGTIGLQRVQDALDELDESQAHRAAANVHLDEAVRLLMIYYPGMQA